MSFLLGRFTFLPCHRELCIVNASIVTVKCFVWICEKHLPPELYLKQQAIIINQLYKVGKDGRKPLKLSSNRNNTKISDIRCRNQKMQ